MFTKRRVGLALVLGAMSLGIGCAETVEDADQTEDELRILPTSSQDVLAANRSRDPVAIAKVLHALASDRTVLPSNYAGLRVERMKQLFEGLDLALVEAVRAAYITANDADPEITIRSDGLFQPLLRLDRADELEMVGALNGAKMTADAKTLADMRGRAAKGDLTAADRTTYFALLPRMGLWDAPVRARAGDRSLDALERTLLDRAWRAESDANGDDLDGALRAIEAKLPAADLTSKHARHRSVAVIASSHGAQWQELMGWAKVMDARGFHLQVFTPDGRPVAFQRDSLSVSAKTAALGFGCPPDLDPAGSAGALAAKILGNATNAARFDATQFGAVYLAGGLGFNEDVAVARPARGSDGREYTDLKANPNIAQMMQRAIAERLPLVAICHGPTLFAATPIDVGGRSEALNKGVDTASLPPFESYVTFTDRKEIQFTYDVNTHHVLEAVGGRTSVVRDIANMHRVVTSRKADIDIISGPGPQAADALAQPTIDAIVRRWR